MSEARRRVVARWRDWAETSIEHLVLSETAQDVVAESVIISRGGGGEPIAVRYRIECDRAWRVQGCEVELVGLGRSLHLVADEDGSWRDGEGRPLPHLAGAIDVDLPVTPFTNTLPIRRLGLRPGQSAEIKAAYIRVPELAVASDPQRYTRLDGTGRYRYESLDSDFTRDIETDSRGLVTLYPGLFRRVL